MGLEHPRRLSMARSHPVFYVYKGHDRCRHQASGQAARRAKVSCHYPGKEYPDKRSANASLTPKSTRAKRKTLAAPSFIPGSGMGRLPSNMLKTRANAANEPVMIMFFSFITRSPHHDFGFPCNPDNQPVGQTYGGIPRFLSHPRFTQSLSGQSASITAILPSSAFSLFRPPYIRQQTPWQDLLF